MDGQNRAPAGAGTAGTLPSQPTSGFSCRLPFARANDIRTRRRQPLAASAIHLSLTVSRSTIHTSSRPRLGTDWFAARYCLTLAPTLLCLTRPPGVRRPPAHVERPPSPSLVHASNVCIAVFSQKYHLAIPPHGLYGSRDLYKRAANVDCGSGGAAAVQGGISSPRSGMQSHFLVLHLCVLFAVPCMPLWPLVECNIVMRVCFLFAEFVTMMTSK